MPRKYMSAPVVLDPALGERQIMVVASDPTLDRTKDVMRPEGCILDNYHENNRSFWRATTRRSRSAMRRR